MYITIEQHNEDMARLRAEHKKEIAKLKATYEKPKIKRGIRPVHPSRIFNEMVIDEMPDMDIKKASLAMGVDFKDLNDFISGKLGASVAINNEFSVCLLSRKLAEFTGTSSLMWIKMQNNFDDWEDA